MLGFQFSSPAFFSYHLPGVDPRKALPNKALVTKNVYFLLEQRTICQKLKFQLFRQFLEMDEAVMNEVGAAIG